MISDKQRQIIQLLLSKKEGYNVNQIARILNISVSWTHETLKLLENQGFLKSQKVANSIFFTINWHNPKAEKVAELILLDNLEQKQIIKKEQPKEEKFVEKEITQNPVFYAVEKNKEVNIPNEKVNPRYNANGHQNPGAKYSPQGNSFSYNSSLQSTINTPYKVTPVGSQGVNNLLFSYAASGAFGGYANNQTQQGGWYGGSATPVPPSSLGSKISSNVSNFTLSMHTSQHKSVTAGCSYCSAAPSQFLQD